MNVAISLEKLERQAPQLVNLRKAVDAALQHNREIQGHKAKVALALDYSGSMSGLYQNGAVQQLAERVLALATAFDDDGDIDIFIFESQAHYVGTLSLDNYQGGINRLVSRYWMGSTNYAAVMRLIREHYQTTSTPGVLGKLFGGGKKTPIYVIFVTDGEPDSRPAAEEQIREAAQEPIFWQFIGVGATQFTFLSQLDTLTGRFVDNAGFFAVPNPSAISDQELYRKMLAEYPSWVRQMTEKGII